MLSSSNIVRLGVVGLLAALLTVVFLTPASGEEKRAKQDSEWYTGRVHVSHDLGGSVGSCTPIATEEGKTLLLTCAHVAQDIVSGGEAWVRIQGWQYLATVADFIPNHQPDLALLTINYEIDTAPIAEDDVHLGQEVYQRGFAHGGMRPDLRVGTCYSRYGDTFLTNLAVEHGDSGAGIFNASGELVGVTYAREFWATTSYAVDSKAVKRFLLREKLRALFPRLAALMDAKRAKSKVAPILPDLPPKAVPAPTPKKADVSPSPATPSVPITGHWEKAGLFGRRSVWVWDSACPNGQCPLKK